VQGYNFALEETLVHALVFKCITSLTVQTNVGSIQDGFFKSFVYLAIINIEMDNLRNFFHKIGIDWTLLLSNGTDIVFSSNPASREVGRRRFVHLSG
jgi:hypothetical protein